MSFRWEIGNAPPPIADHTRAKLRVLRHYLREYFDTLITGRPLDNFKLDLVDGFAGGGTYSDGKDVLAGSPLVMLEESSEAAQRLTKDRRKPLLFDVRHYFVEKDRAHAEHLSAVLHERGYLPSDGRIVLFKEKDFHDVVQEVIIEIEKHQPRSGKSIFLLDQCGFLAVGMDTIRLIRDRLPRAGTGVRWGRADMLSFASSEKAAVATRIVPDVQERSTLPTSRGCSHERFVADARAWQIDSPTRRSSRARSSG